MLKKAKQEEEAKRAEQAWQKERAEFYQLYERYGSEAYQHACLVLQCDQGAEEVVQETIVRLLQEPDRAWLESHYSMRSTIRRATMRTAVAYSRLWEQESHVDWSDMADQFTRMSEVPVEPDRYRAVFTSLPIRHQEVLLLRFDRGLLLKGIAEEKDWPTQEAFQRLTEAYEALKTAVEQGAEVREPAVAPVVNRRRRGQYGLDMLNEPHTFSPGFGERLLERLDEVHAQQCQDAPKKKKRISRTLAAAMLCLAVLVPCITVLPYQPNAYGTEDVPSCLETMVSVPFSEMYSLTSGHEVDYTFHLMEVGWLPEGVEQTEVDYSSKSFYFTYEGDGWLIYISQELCDADGTYDTLDLRGMDGHSLKEHQGEMVLETYSDGEEGTQFVKLYRESGSYLICVIVSRLVDGVMASPEEDMGVAYAILDSCTLPAEN